MFSKISNYFDDWFDQDLLALGERIGNVNTGLSEDLFSKCLTETIYCSSEQSQDEGNCVICLVCSYSPVDGKYFTCFWINNNGCSRILLKITGRLQEHGRCWNT